MTDSAYELAEHGYSVFPVTRGGTRPLSGRHGYRDATTDPLRIDELFTWPDLNVGVRTGRDTGLFVLHVHGARGRESARKLQLPPTLAVRTPIGFHLYFELPGEAGCPSGRGLLPGVDAHCNDSFVLAPGSITLAGTYVVARQLPIALVPSDLLRMAQDAGGRPRWLRRLSGKWS